MNQSSRVKYRSTGPFSPQEYRSAFYSLWKAIMRNAAVRSNLLVPEIREVMDIRQASNYLGISADTLQVRFGWICAGVQAGEPLAVQAVAAG